MEVVMETPVFLCRDMPLEDRKAGILQTCQDQSCLCNAFFFRGVYAMRFS